MTKHIIHTDKAPTAIGCYSQAVRVDKTVYLSGQVGFNPQTMELAVGFENQAHQMFKNLQAVVEAAGGTLSDIVKLNIYLTDMNDFAITNQVMAEYFNEPYPARAAIAVKQLPREALIEADGIMVLI